MKRLAPLLLALAGLASFLFLSGCTKQESERAMPQSPTSGSSTTDAQDQKRIYFIVKASESEFWQIVIAGAKKKAEELKVHLIAQAPVSESDVSRQIAILENAISS